MKYNLQDELIQYDRKKAVEYAKYYALTPNIKEYPYYEDHDCANFVSQCIKAGGIKFRGNEWDDLDSWFSNTNKANELSRVSLTWRGARYFRRYWGNENGLGNNKAFKYIEIISSDVLDNFQDIYSFLKVGDVIQYGKKSNNYTPNHTQIIINKTYNSSYNISDLYMAQHSANRIYISLYEYISNFKDKDRKIYLYKIIGD
ncbi:amidase domain-containing protein [Clostridium grantii]|uniref:Putative amidase domain-containing protein n=1 Tax=Clostridium grantii DSM 8605 TaxID=1121316 RepID=A0A1M5W4P0_9CLOT|nr:amidase domain-containing protein [Clostridium grantii]SHH82539.1 Putative amidase domain-containing protein [Clostridium grantii DSM 8605]